MTLTDMFKSNEFKNKIEELEKENGLLKAQIDIKLSIKKQSNFILDQQLNMLNAQIIEKQQELTISEQNISKSIEIFELTEKKYNKLKEKHSNLKSTYSSEVNEIRVDKMEELQEKKRALKAPHCPKCKSTNIQILDNKKKAFSVGKAVGGAALTGGVGTIAGFAGKRGKKYQAICLNCGKSFDIKL